MNLIEFDPHCGDDLLDIDLQLSSFSHGIISQEQQNGLLSVRQEQQNGLLSVRQEHRCLACRRYIEEREHASLLPSDTFLYHNEVEDERYPPGTIFVSPLLSGLINNHLLRTHASSELRSHLLHIEAHHCNRSIYLFHDRVRSISSALREDRSRIESVRKVLELLKKEITEIDPNLELLWSDARKQPMLRLVPGNYRGYRMIGQDLQRSIPLSMRRFLGRIPADRLLSIDDSQLLESSNYSLILQRFERIQ